MTKRKRKDKEPKEAPVVKKYVQPPPGLQEFIFYIVESNEDMNAEFCDKSCPSSKIEIIGADMAYIVHRLDSSVEVQLVDKEVSPDPNVSYIKKSITCRILKGIEYNWRLEVAADDHDTVITTPSSVRDYAEEFVKDMLKEKIFQARQDQEGKGRNMTICRYTCILEDLDRPHGEIEEVNDRASL